MMHGQKNIKSSPSSGKCTSINQNKCCSKLYILSLTQLTVAVFCFMELDFLIMVVASGVLFHGGGRLDDGGGRHRNMLECRWTALEFLSHNKCILLDQFLDNDLIDTNGTSNIVKFVLMLSCVSEYLAAVLSVIYLLVQNVYRSRSEA